MHFWTFYANANASKSKTLSRSLTCSRYLFGAVDLTGSYVVDTKQTSILLLVRSQFTVFTVSFWVTQCIVFVLFSTVNGSLLQWVLFCCCLLKANPTRAAETFTKSAEKYSVCAGRRTHENVGKIQHATKKINGQHTRKSGDFFSGPKTFYFSLYNARKHEDFGRAWHWNWLLWRPNQLARLLLVNN